MIALLIYILVGAICTLSFTDYLYKKGESEDPAVIMLCAIVWPLFIAAFIVGFIRAWREK